MTAGLSRRELLPPAELLHWAELLRADAREAIAGSQEFSLHLDLVVADLEFARALGERPHPELTRSWHRALELLRAARDVGPWLYGGAAQVGWTAIALGLAPPPVVDDIVLRWIADYPPDGDVDLPRGLLGLGCYAVAHPDAEVREQATAGVLRVVSARVEQNADGLCLRLPDNPLHRSTASVGHRLLGACHGVAGLVSYLAAVTASGLRCAPQAEPLLAGALRWLLRQRAPVGGSIFPRSTETRTTAARSAWCHGDPGVWLGLDAAADVTRSPDVATAAAGTAAAVLARPAADSGVVDSCLCHGAAGLVWLGGRIAARRTGGELGVAQRFVAHWARRLVEQRAAGPLRYRRGPGDGGWEPCASFLEGDLGAALALLSAATGTRPGWEQLVLAAPAVRPAVPA